MKHTVKKLADSQVEITVEVDKDVWQTAQKKEFDKALKNVSIKGFRKGKAPASMAAAYVNPNRVMDEALNAVLTPVYSSVITEEKLQPFSRPNVNVSKVSDTELTLVFTVTLMPSVKLGTYKGLTAKREAVKVTDKEIADSIEKRLQNAAELEIVDREAKLGDTVVLDFKGYIDGKAFDGGEAENYSLELGSNSFVPGFEDALVGVKAEEEKDVNITFPEKYVAELAGKPATFHCHIHEVKEKKIPALDDTSVKDLGIKDVETVDALKEYEKKEILTNKTNASNRDFYEAIVKQIVDGAEVEIASSIIDSEAATQEENTKKQIESNGLTFQQYLEITGQKEEDLKKQLKESSTANLKRFLVLNEIARAEHMIVDDNELNVELSKMAEQYKMKVEDIRKALGNQIENFRENLQSRKIQDFILANNGTAAAKPTAKKESASKDGKADSKEAPKAKKAPAKKAAPKAKKTETK